MVHFNGSLQSHDQRPLSGPNNNKYHSKGTHHQLSKPALTVTSINIEGFSENKSELLSQLCKKTNCDILCVQETHRGPEHLRPKVSGMTLVLEIPHAQYGSAIFVKPNVTVVSATWSNENSIEILTVDIGTCTITSVYKPPNQPFEFRKTPNFDSRPTKLIVGDFNSHSINWGYSVTNADGNLVEEWADASELTLVHNAKQPASFNSRRWKRGYNPDLIFVSSNIHSLSSKLVCQPIPNTQHRPITCEIQAAIKPRQVPYKPRFNFSKANWEKFSVDVDAKLCKIEPTPSNYEQFVDTIWTVSRQSIPRGCRTSYISGLDPESSKLLKIYEDLYENDPFSEDTIAAGEELMSMVGETRKANWITTVTTTNMTHNSKKAWSTIQKLTGEPPEPSNQGFVTANKIAHQLLLNGKPPHRLPKVEKAVNVPSNSTKISTPFTLTDIILAIKTLKNGKAAGVDDLTVEQIKNLGPVAVSWLLALFNTCLATAKIPKLWRRTKVVALPKPGKPTDDPKSYRPISLLCHTYKLFERLLLNRLTAVIEPALIPEQAGFRPGKSCSSQVLRLTQYIEDGYENNRITGVVFVDLSAAYDTINIKRLLAKVSTLTNDQGFVNILSELLFNRRFQVSFQSGKSRWRRQKNGLPQGSVLAPTLFNIYTNDQPITQHTERFLYADDLALAAQSVTFADVEDKLSLALDLLGNYYDSNALRPNPSKTESCAFHLRNKYSNRALNITWRGTIVEHCSNPKYLGVTLDRALTYKSHCCKTKQKVGTRNNLLRRLIATNWGASPDVLRTTGMALCFSAGEFACQVWHRSTHAKQVDIALNETCRIISGCLKPTPLNKLYPLAGIAPPAVRRDVACALEKKIQESDARHPLYNYTMIPGRLKSRNSFLRSTQAIQDKPPIVRSKLWEENHPPPTDFVKAQEHLPPGRDQQWPIWKALNRLRTQVGRCRHNLSKWGIIDSSNTQCECGASDQTMPHLLECPKCPFTCTLDDLYNATDAAINVATYWASTI